MSHISPAIQQAQEAKEASQALDVVKQLQAINNTTLTILKEARDAKQNVLALQAVDRVMKQLELQAKLLGDLDATPQVNILLTSEWQATRSALMQALLPYPDAKASVVGALAALERTNRDRLN